MDNNFAALFNLITITMDNNFAEQMKYAGFKATTVTYLREEQNIRGLSDFRYVPELLRQLKFAGLSKESLSSKQQQRIHFALEYLTGAMVQKVPKITDDNFSNAIFICSLSSGKLDNYIESMTPKLEVSSPWRQIIDAGEHPVFFPRCEPNQCSGCGRLCPDGEKADDCFEMCKLCFTTRYCSYTCYKANMPYHRGYCEYVQQKSNNRRIPKAAISIDDVKAGASWKSHTIEQYL